MRPEGALRVLVKLITLVYIHHERTIDQTEGMSQKAVTHKYIQTAKCTGTKVTINWHRLE